MADMAYTEIAVVLEGEKEIQLARELLIPSDRIPEILSCVEIKSLRDDLLAKLRQLYPGINFDKIGFLIWKNE